MQSTPRLHLLSFQIVLFLEVHFATKPISLTQPSNFLICALTTHHIRFRDRGAKETATRTDRVLARPKQCTYDFTGWSIIVLANFEDHINMFPHIRALEVGFAIPHPKQYPMCYWKIPVVSIQWRENEMRDRYFDSPKYESLVGTESH